MTETPLIDQLKLGKCDREMDGLIMCDVINSLSGTTFAPDPAKPGMISLSPEYSLLTPALTTSLDAVIGELSKLKWRWRCGIEDAAYFPVSYAWVWISNPVEQWGYLGNTSVPVAMCIALLRAAAAQKRAT
jgi:hypothetical protein